jgi:mycothiol system anti-sigma-R factor
MTCKEAVKNLYVFLDGEIAPARGRKLQKHLEECRRCCQKFEFEKALKAFIKEKAVQAPVPRSLQRNLAALLKEF